MSDYDHSIHSNPSAAAWARFFCETFPEGGPRPDEGTMLGWFANAMCAALDARGVGDLIPSPAEREGRKVRDGE